MSCSRFLVGALAAQLFSFALDAADGPAGRPAGLRLPPLQCPSVHGIADKQPRLKPMRRWYRRSPVRYEQFLGHDHNLLLAAGF